MAGFYKETQSLTNYNSVFFCVYQAFGNEQLGAG